MYVYLHMKHIKAFFMMFIIKKFELTCLTYTFNWCF